VNISGDKQSVMNFLKDMKSVKPVVNLVFVDYSESRSNPKKPTVTALLRFESYALKLSSDNIKLNSPKQFKDTDKALKQLMNIEKFQWDQTIADKIQLLN
jgi:hypothetical protein